MTERVYLHVGAPKSGTTYIQAVLEANRARLADAGVLVVGETHLDRVHAGMVVREDPRLETLPERARHAWDRLITQIKEWSGPSAILSYEMLASASAEQVTRALADLEGLEIHVVLTARSLAATVPSAWQERVKYGLTTPLDEWSPRPESDGPRAEWGWRAMDPSGVAARWGAELPADRVHIVTMPSSSSDSTALWRRYAEATGVGQLDLDLTPQRSNESLGVVQAELLRRVNVAVGGPLENSREQAVWVRDTLAHLVLAPQSGDRIGITEQQLADAADRSRRCIDTLRSAGYVVHGDLDDLAARPVQGRVPDEVGAEELLEGAVTAVADLLMLVRERTRERNRLRGELEAPPPATGVMGRAKRLVRDASAVALRRETAALRQQVERLERQLQEHRSLQLRVAELSDLVSELVLPVGLRDDAAFETALARYREESL